MGERVGRSVCDLMNFYKEEEGDAKNGLKLAKKLNMDQYAAPKQYTPQAASIPYLMLMASKPSEKGTSTGVTYKGC